MKRKIEQVLYKCNLKLCSQDLINKGEKKNQRSCPMKNQRWNKYVFDKWAKKFRTHAQWHNKKENLSLSPSIERTRERNNVKPECIQWEREKTESVNGKEMMKQKCISQKMAKQELGKKRFKTHAYQIDIAIFSKSLGTLLPTQMSSSWSNLHKNSAKLNTLDWNVKPSPLVPQIYVIENGLWKWTKKLKEKKQQVKKEKKVKFTQRWIWKTDHWNEA